MLNTFRARLIALIALLVVLRVVQWVYVDRELHAYQELNAAQTNNAVVTSEQTRIYGFTLQLYIASQTYANGILVKDLERTDKATNEIKRLIDEIKVIPPYHSLFLEELRETLVDERPVVDAFVEKVLQVLETPSNAPNVANAGNNASALRDAQGAVDQAFESAASLFDSQIPLVTQDLRARERETRERGEAFDRATVFALIVEGLIFIAVTIWFALGLSKGFRTLETTIGDINTGNLDARAAMSGKDELSRIGQSFDKLLDERLVAEAAKRRENDAINESAITLLGAVVALSDRDLRVRAPVDDNIVGTIASSINQLADETAEALSSVQSLSVQMEEATLATRQQSQEVDRAIALEQTLLKGMEITLADASEQLLEVSALSQRSAASAGRTADAAAAAQNAVGTTLRGMENLRQGMGDTEKRFKSLGQRSQEISNAVALINTISERTHVLSLNASIQAAAAGEAGRGFAVVASEVQRLSDASSKAANEIAAMVGNIQAETNESLVTLSGLVSDVVEQSTLAELAAQEMQSAQTATQELIAMVAQIATSSELQQGLATSLRASISEVNQSTIQTSSAMSAQRSLTETLVDYALGLRQSVAEFKLDQPTPKTPA